MLMATLIGRPRADVTRPAAPVAWGVYACIFAALSCLMGTDVLAEESKMALRIQSPAFANGGEIPTKYSCQGDDIAPPLAAHIRCSLFSVDRAQEVEKVFFPQSVTHGFPLLLRSSFRIFPRDRNARTFTFALLQPSSSPASFTERPSR